MTCAACSHRNRDTAKFCENCGQPLGDQSPTAQPSADPRTYTPSHLAQRILTDRAALEGERKQVTVLFADIKDSMELAERVGAEEWHKILDDFFHLLNEGVHRFEGTVNQYTGDGIMALFGAPIAHEDHAQRACHAALHLRDRLRAFGAQLERSRGLAFAVRMGLNSGEVVVGRVGDDLRMDYTAQGHTVGLAQRVEQIAAPNTACVAQATAAPLRSKASANPYRCSSWGARGASAAASTSCWRAAEWPWSAAPRSSGCSSKRSTRRSPATGR
jgi:class 3 adenylate cyclase